MHTKNYKASYPGNHESGPQTTRKLEDMCQIQTFCERHRNFANPFRLVCHLNGGPWRAQEGNGIYNNVVTTSRTAFYFLQKADMTEHQQQGIKRRLPDGRKRPTILDFGMIDQEPSDVNNITIFRSLPIDDDDWAPRN